MTKLFFLPEGQEPDYDPIPNTRNDDLMAEIFPDLPPEVQAALTHRAIAKMMSDEDDAIAHLLLENMQFLDPTDYADRLLYARLAVLNVHRFNDTELYEPEITEAVHLAVKKFHETRGGVQHG